MKTILITGIYGHLGNELALTLSKSYKVIGLDYCYRKTHSINNKFKIYFSSKNELDVIFKKHKIDIIVHTATFYSEIKNELNIVFESNLVFSCKILSLAIKYNVNFFINTDTVLDRYTNSYSLSKRHFQEWLYFNKNEINIINLKLEYFYGPKAGENNFIIKMLKTLVLDNQKIPLTKGIQLRNFIYIDDVCSAYQIVIDKINSFTSSYIDLDVCSNYSISIKNLMLILKKITKSNADLNFGIIPYRENELMMSISDNTKLSKLGWSPKIDLEDGIRKCHLKINSFKNS